MNAELSPDTPRPEPAARSRPSWKSVMDLKPGMVIAKTVSGSWGGYATMTLREGGVITEETIAQMIVKGIECVAVRNTSPPSEQDYAHAVQDYEARLQEVFGAAPNTACQALLDAMRARGPVPC